MLYICNELNISKNNMCEEVVEVKQNIEEEIDYKNLYIRLLADHDNYVKRTRETISNTTRQSQSKTMVETVLPIYNDLYCAVIQNIEGSVLLLNKLKTTIESAGYSIIDKDFVEYRCVGIFDESYCEAISTTIGDGVSNMVSFVTKVGLYDEKKKQTIAYAQCIVTN